MTSYPASPQDDALVIAARLTATPHCAACREMREHASACLEQQAARLRELGADAAEGNYLIDRLSHLLAETAIALRGPEGELTRHSYHDIPERARASVSRAEALHEALASTAANVAAMRERCAKACDRLEIQGKNNQHDSWAGNCAAAIRALPLKES